MVLCVVEGDSWVPGGYGLTCTICHLVGERNRLSVCGQVGEWCWLDYIVMMHVVVMVVVVVKVVWGWVMMMLTPQ